MKSIVIFTALLFASGTVRASDWLSLGKTADGDSETFVDRATITVVGNIRSAVFKYVPEHHIDMYRKEWIERSEELSEYDCKKSTVRAMTLIIYLEGGHTHTQDFPPAWESVTAPWDQLALKYLCAWQGDY